MGKGQKEDEGDDERRGGFVMAVGGDGRLS